MKTLSFLPHPVLMAPAIIIALGVGIAASSEARTSPLPMACAVELRDVGHSVEITARLIAFDTIEGDYELAVRQTSANGQAQINQGGPFLLTRGDDVILSQTFLMGDPANIDTDFTLNWNGLALACPAQTL